MRYKNIVFDFGNVIGSFDADYILDRTGIQSWPVLKDRISQNCKIFLNMNILPLKPLPLFRLI